MSSKMGDSLFKLGRYNRVFLEFWAQILIWAPMLKQRKYSKRAHRDPQKFILFIKTSKWEKWWPWWLRMTNAFILCNLLWKVQKNLAANREGSFQLKSGTDIATHIMTTDYIPQIRDIYSVYILYIWILLSIINIFQFGKSLWTKRYFLISFFFF